METKAGLPADSAKAGPKDIFLHLLSIIALYVSAGSFVALIFNYINVWLPDAISENYYSLLSAYSSIRWALATIVVVFPVYVWSVRFLNKGYTEIPEKREIKTRKWLIYFTLFAAGIIIIGDLVTLIYNFLQGELTLRFVLKILTVLLAAATIFGYYLLDLRRERMTHPLSSFSSKVFSYVVILIVLIAIIAGFFIAGSPKEERARKFDEQRVSNLQFIQGEIINYWLRKAALPQKLDELRDDIRGVSIPQDPENGTAYAYEMLGPESFKLCAVFNRPSLGKEFTAPQPARPYYYPEPAFSENWSHDSGSTCFDRKIDKDLYKPEKPR